MKNKLSITYLISTIAPFFFSCRGPVKGENKINALASFVSPADGAGEKYIIDTKESVVAWKGSSVGGGPLGVRFYIEWRIDD